MLKISEDLFPTGKKVENVFRLGQTRRKREVAKWPHASEGWWEVVKRRRKERGTKLAQLNSPTTRGVCRNIFNVKYYQWGSAEQKYKNTKTPGANKRKMAPYVKKGMTWITPYQKWKITSPEGKTRYGVIKGVFTNFCNFTS